MLENRGKGCAEQSEVSQEEKDKHSVVMPTYGISNTVLASLFTGQERRHRPRKQACGRSGGRRRRGKRRETHWRIRTAARKAGSWWEASVQHRELSSEPCDDWRAARAFLSLWRAGVLSSCNAQAPGCVGFRNCGSLALEHRLNSRGTWAQLPRGMRDPDQG